MAGIIGFNLIHTFEPYDDFEVAKKADQDYEKTKRISTIDEYIEIA